MAKKNAAPQKIVPKHPSVEELLKQANEECRLAIHQARSSLRHAVASASHLLEIQARPAEYGGHGHWMLWLNEHYCVPNEISYRTVAKWLQVARHWTEIESKLPPTASIDAAAAIVGKLFPTQQRKRQGTEKPPAATEEPTAATEAPAITAPEQPVPDAGHFAGTTAAELDHGSAADLTQAEAMAAVAALNAIDRLTEDIKTSLDPSKPAPTPHAARADVLRIVETLCQAKGMALHVRAVAPGKKVSLKPQPGRLYLVLAEEQPC